MGHLGDNSPGLEVTVAIPTYMREQPLLDTIDQLLGLAQQADEILVVDQTPVHSQEVEERLQLLDSAGRLRWLRLTKPSIPGAMNRALQEAGGDVVLFLDDDVELTSEIVAAHTAAFLDHDVALAAGRVVQSWQQEVDVEGKSQDYEEYSDPDGFPFYSTRWCRVSRFMGGNFSVKKKVALELGGFDENFVKVAYRFEAEFADRLLAAGYHMVFEPQAGLRHLKAEQGGTRTFGEHLTTCMPFHAVGRYYYLLVGCKVVNRFSKIILGPLQAIWTRFHLAHPWWIPASLLAESSGLLWALWLRARGPRYVRLRRGLNTQAETVASETGEGKSEVIP